jgi:hypothetical protein
MTIEHLPIRLLTRSVQNSVHGDVRLVRRCLLAGSMPSKPVETCALVEDMANGNGGIDTRIATEDQYSTNEIANL